MQSVLRKGRLVAAVLVGTLGATLSAAPVRAAAPLEKALPGTTLVYLQVEDARQFREALKASPIGQLLSDPAMKPLIDDARAKIEEVSKQSQTRLGLSLEELVTLPQGPVTIALVPSEGQATPVALLVSADAGDKATQMAGLMDKLTKLAQEEGKEKVKVGSEDFKGLKLTTLQGEGADAPLVWTQQGNIFHLASSTAALKDVLSNADGREDGLGSNPNFAKIKEKAVSDAQLVWFLNIEQAFKLIGKALEARGGGNAAQVEAQLQLTGLGGLKAAGGGVTMNTGPYATLSKAYLFAPGESEGIVRLFVLPKVDLKPPAWVPASVASYQSISWDLDAAYKAINDLAESVAPGVLAAMEQNLAGPQGEGLKFERDIFGPLGDRLTIISDFKKESGQPEASQRILFALALEDAKATQATLNKVLDLTNAQPKKREFQGTTLYDFEIPEIPNAEAAGLKGPISVAIAKDNLFVTTDPALLEQVLRGGAPTLADSPEFQAVAKQFPATASTLSFQRPEQSARAVYDMLKSGQLKTAFEQGAKNAGGNAEVPEIFNPDKLPEFSVFAKYLTLGGGYSVMEPDGVTFTQFSLKK